MDFKKVNEKLQKLLELFQINEMTIKDQPCFGEADNIMDAVEKLKTLRRGSFIIPDKLRIKKEITQEDIDYGYASQIHKGYVVEIKYPMKMVYGETDIYKQGQQKTGHGITHATKGHENKFIKALKALPQILLENVAVLDTRKNNFNNNYVIKTNRFIYAFALKDGYAILITGLEK